LVGHSLVLLFPHGNDGLAWINPACIIGYRNNHNPAKPIVCMIVTDNNRRANFLISLPVEGSKSTHHTLPLIIRKFP
jgi:hypothetical protein